MAECDESNMWVRHNLQTPAAETETSAFVSIGYNNVNFYAVILAVPEERQYGAALLVIIAILMLAALVVVGARCYILKLDYDWRRNQKESNERRAEEIAQVSVRRTRIM